MFSAKLTDWIRTTSPIEGWAWIIAVIGGLAGILALGAVVGTLLNGLSDEASHLKILIGAICLCSSGIICAVMHLARKHG